MRKVTIVFEDDDLYTAIKVQAARLNRSVKDIVSEALSAWVEAQGDVEDLADHRSALAEYQVKGGVSWDEVKRRAREVISERHHELV